MSAHNTPSQRPVQHNPYATTPPLGPRPAPTVSPPAQNLPPSETAPSQQQQQQQSSYQAHAGAVGSRFSSHHHNGGGETNTPKGALPAFMGGGGYSMYVATPQHGAQNTAPIPARMSPGPALGPSATTALAAPDTPNGRSGSVHSEPPSYESLLGRVSPQAASTNSNNGHQSVFGGWSVAAQHPPSNNTSTFSGHHGFHGYPGPGAEDKGSSHHGSRFALHNDNSGSNSALRGAFIGDDTFPLLMQNVPRLTPYTQPTYNQSTNSGSGQHHGHHHQQQNSIPQSMPSANSGSGNANGPRPGASAHVFLMHKLRYIPLSSEFFIQQPRHQSQNMMGGGNGGNPMMSHPMQMQPDRPIQMFNGRGRPLQDFCPTADLFVAQLPFNMELTALQYLFDMVSQVPADIIHAAPHYKRGRSYDGCAFVKVSQNVAAILVDTFHKAALFDEEGVWVADSAEQRATLANYCGFMQQKSPQERRALLRKPIPFSAMTVEFANRSYAF